jgi:hypothetical protein
VGILHDDTVTWRRGRDGWACVAPSGLDARLDVTGFDSPGGLLTLHHDRGFVNLVDHGGATRLSVRRGTSTRAVVGTAAGRYRVVKQLMRPIWDVTPEVAGDLIVQVLGIGPVLRLRPAAGAADLSDKELSDLHRGVIVGILCCRHELPGVDRAPAAA